MTEDEKNIIKDFIENIDDYIPNISNNITRNLSEYLVTGRKTSDDIWGARQIIIKNTKKQERYIKDKPEDLQNILLILKKEISLQRHEESNWREKILNRHDY